MLFFVEDFQRGTCRIPPEEAKHLQAYRVNLGQTIYLTDGKGRVATAIVTGISRHDCRAEVKSITDYPNTIPYNLEIAIAPTKNIDRTEWFVEKATELGISSIAFISTEHSERTTVNLERIQRILISAIKQSKKYYLPTLSPIVPFSEWLNRRNKSRVRMIAHCNQAIERAPITKHLSSKNITILIGPEGDFSTSEIEQAAALGYKSITLGPSILRTETAAVVATSAVYLHNLKTLSAQ